MRLIIDTDAGVDDSQAILMAFAQPHVTVEAITTVTGNVHVEKVNRNIFTLLDLAGQDVPVYQGADQPLVPGYWEAEESIHGSDGLGDYKQRRPTKRQLEAEHAAFALIRMANEAPRQLTLVALGPLTNIALACKLDPSFPAKIKQFTFMGGTITAFGNTRNVTTEFNIFCDPEAALITLSAFPESVMLSWETTLEHPFSWAQYDQLCAIKSDMAGFFHATTGTTAQFLRGIAERMGYLLPDPLAMAVTLDPNLILECEPRYVTVELMGTQTRGQTVIDHLGRLGNAPNVQIVKRLDIEGVYRLYREMLGG